MLLAIRELFYGNRRFDQIVRNTGAPRDRLAARLRALEAAGVVERHRYQQRPDRYEYHLSAAGRDLGPVFQALVKWGDTWAVDSPPVHLEHGDHELDAAWVCRHCGREVHTEDLEVRMSTTQWDRRGPVDPGS